MGEMKFSNLEPNSLCKILLVQFSKKEEKDKTYFYILMQNPSNQRIYQLDTIQILRIIDKQIEQGKLTIIVKKFNDQIIVFFHKTTKEILDNFLNQIKKCKQGNVEIIDLDIDKKNGNQIPAIIENNKKRKFTNFYNNNANFSNFNNKIMNKSEKQITNIVYQNPNIQAGKKFKEQKSAIVPEIKTKINLLTLPYCIHNLMLEYLDRNSLIRLTLVNREAKNVFDSHIENLHFKDDTPSNMFFTLMKRFQQNLKEIYFNKARTIKNENFKNFILKLEKLEFLEISHLSKLNESSIKKLISRGTLPHLKGIKLNFNMESLFSALICLNQSFKELEKLDLYSPFSYKKLHIIFDNLEKNSLIHNDSFYKLLSETLEAKKMLNSFKIFILNFLQVPKACFGNSLKKLLVLEIDILIVRRLSEIRIFGNADSLKSLKITEILVIDKCGQETVINSNNFKAHYSRIDLETYHNMINNYLLSNSNIIDETNNQLNNLSLTDEFDNDYIEIFNSIFSKLQQLESLSLGQFVNPNLLKIISLYLKNLTNITISSNRISDEHFSLVLQNCVKLNYIDLRNSIYIYGNCFLDNILPSNLKLIETSIESHNFHILAENLRIKGIKINRET
jgi:hypothetical protein